MNEHALLRWAIVLRSALCAVLIALTCTRANSATERVALVIGNNAYADAPLENPTKDARAIADALRKLGFTVVEAIDADKNEMEQSIAKMRGLLKGRSAVGMLYYAGHAIQLEWRNYLIPVDARLTRPRDVATQTIDVQAVIDAFKEAGNRLNIIVLDACRDNPFGATGRGYGLAPLDAPTGTFLAYSTAPGNVAEDGTADSGNSLYTASLVMELGKPDSRIEDVFKRVRLHVRKRTAGRQVPWESTSLEEDFYFGTGTRDLEVSPDAREAQFREQLAAWDRIKDSTDATAFYDFLQRYPNGSVSEQAQFRLDQLQKVRVSPQPVPGGVSVMPAGTNRYAVGDEFVYDRIDGFTKVATRRVDRVTSADDRRVEINGGSVVLDQAGAVIRNRFGLKSPGIMTSPSDIALGKRWRSDFTNTPDGGETTQNYWDFHVVALEDVTVPAGTFKAFKVERVGRATGKGPLTYMKATHWIDPRTMLIVRNDIMFRTGGKITDWSSDRLVSVSRAGGR